VFAASTAHHSGDPFAKHLTPDQQDAAISAFRGAIGLTVGLCLAGAVVAVRWIPGREAGKRPAPDVG
jgi:hypothetical protein